jgi:group II intron reverse transcriptase/maturase
MAAVLDRDNLKKAYRAVRSNRGSAGVDGLSIERTAEHLHRHWPVIASKLAEGSYRPSAVRGVRIPKAGGGERLLGIPTVQDRIIQQALAQVLTPKFEPGFSEHSYGFRPGHSAHDAVRAAQGYLRAGKTWVVDLDITAFFDHVNHDILMHRIGRIERDPQVLRLIGRYLRAPLEVDGRREQRMAGTPQGGPLSPLLANIYLDALDQELERRGLSFCRYADDLMIYVGSERSAQRVLESVSRWIEQHLRLQVNASKSGTGRPWERPYLGFILREDGHIALAESSIQRFRAQVCKHWDARQSRTSGELVARWQRFLRGWCAYFGLAEERRGVTCWEGWIRRHMRKCFWLRWHNRQGRRNALQRLGVPQRHWQLASSGRGAWRIARSWVLHSALSNRVLARYGLWMPSQLWAAR